MVPLLTQLYERYLQDDDCPSFIRDVSQRYGNGTLEKLTASPTTLTRRAAVLSIGFLGDYSANSTLGSLLRDPDSTVRSMAEQAIQHVWFRMGTEEEQKELLFLERLNLANEFERTIQRSTQLIETNPEIAEAWNQRSIAYFNLTEFAASIRDCYQTIHRNPFHYPAAIGMGHSYLEINDTFNAIESFKRALSLNPGLTFLRAQINFLKKDLDNHRS